MTKKVVSWATYDFADQAFQALFITLLFPVFLVRLGYEELWIGLVASGATMLAALSVPFVGALSDATGRRLPILFFAAVASSLFIVAIGFTPIFWIPLFAFCAKVAHDISKDVYDAKMIDVTTPDKYGTLSGIGNTFAYAGTIVSLAAAAPIFVHYGWESEEAISATFILIAAWYVIFIIPIMLFVPDRAYQQRRQIGPAMRHAWRGVLRTLRMLPFTQPLGRFLAASFFYSNALTAIVLFLGVFSMQEVGLTLREFFPVFALLALTSGIGSALSGRISDKIGPVRVLRVCLIAWIVIIGILMFNVTFLMFIILGTIGGLFFGSVWTMNRHMIANITPPREIAKIFGFEGLISRSSSIVGTALFGAAVTFFSYTVALMIMVFMIAIGLIILRKL